MDDWTLLRRYAETGSEEDFGTLVARHIDHVYSVAARETNDPQLAQDVTQATFIVLAKKAARIRPGTVLSGWLFKTVRFAAHNARRGEWRRHIREKEAAEMNATENHPEPEARWEEISPLLNDALASLNETDRAAVLLRFFEKKAHDEIAAALGTNGASARKRLSRALERLREFFVKRGVSVTNASLLTILTDHAVQTAPAGLVQSFAAAASVSAGTAASVSIVVQQTLKVMAWTKLKMTAAVVAGVMLVSGTATVLAPPLLKRGSYEKTLPDGTTFSLVDHQFTDRFDFRYQSDGRWWQRSLRSVLPGDVANGILGSPSSSRIVASSPGGESLFLATVERGRSSSEVGRLQVIGDDGSVSDGIFAAGTIVMNERAQIWRANPFPRRARELTLRFFTTGDGSNQKWRQAAEFVIENPVSGPFPQWIPEPVPATKTDGDVAVTLNALETGMPYDGAADISSFWKGLPATRVHFSIRQQERERSAWTVRKITVSDATGNEWTPDGLSARAPSGAAPELEAVFIGALWANEPAWKFRLELSRTNDFAPHELLEVTDVPVPDDGEVIPLSHSYEVNGAPVHIAFIGGSQGKLPQPFEWSQLKDHINLAVTAKGRKQEKRFALVTVRDDRGRHVEFTDKRAQHGSDLLFGLKPARGARTLSFTFAMHQSRFVEFLAKPKQMGAVSQR